MSVYNEFGKAFRNMVMHRTSSDMSNEEHAKTRYSAFADYLTKRNKRLRTTKISGLQSQMPVFGIHQDNDRP